MVFHGNGIVWDTKSNKRLMKFVEGKFETDDKRIIEVLIKAGYEHEEPATEPVIYEPIKPVKKPVRKKAV